MKKFVVIVLDSKDEKKMKDICFQIECLLLKPEFTRSVEIRMRRVFWKRRKTVCRYYSGNQFEDKWRCLVIPNAKRIAFKYVEK